jgi:hypothetical protein
VIAEEQPLRADSRCTPVWTSSRTSASELERLCRYVSRPPANTEALHRRSFVSVRDNCRARAHMLFFADNGLDSRPAIVVERFGRIFEEAVLTAGLAWRHCGRQVNHMRRRPRGRWQALAGAACAASSWQASRAVEATQQFCSALGPAKPANLLKRETARGADAPLSCSSPAFRSGPRSRGWLCQVAG